MMVDTVIGAWFCGISEDLAAAFVHTLCRHDGKSVERGRAASRKVEVVVPSVGLLETIYWVLYDDRRSGWNSASLSLHIPIRGKSEHPNRPFNLTMRACTRLWQQTLRLTLFTRENCSLCVEAKSVLSNVWDKRAFAFDEINVMAAEQQKWKAVYEFDTPVVTSTLARGEEMSC